MQCPECGRDRPLFVIVAGKCDFDREEAIRALVTGYELTMDDVRARRECKLLASDRFFLVDIYETLSDADRDELRIYRQALRDVTASGHVLIADADLTDLIENPPALLT